MWALISDRVHIYGSKSQRQLSLYFIRCVCTLSQSLYWTEDELNSPPNHTQLTSFNREIFHSVSQILFFVVLFRYLWPKNYGGGENEMRFFPKKKNSNVWMNWKENKLDDCLDLYVAFRFGWLIVTFNVTQNRCILSTWFSLSLSHLLFCCIINKFLTIQTKSFRSNQKVINKINLKMRERAISQVHKCEVVSKRRHRVLYTLVSISYGSIHTMSDTEL